MNYYHEPVVKLTSEHIQANWYKFSCLLLCGHTVTVADKIRPHSLLCPECYKEKSKNK